MELLYYNKMNFKLFHEKYRTIVDKELELFLNKKIKGLEINEPIIKYFYGLIKSYALNNAKRLRPVILILSYFASGGKDERKVMPAAVAIELLHTYTLILDDIMDEDEFRRNKPTIYYDLKKYFINNFGEEIYEGSLFAKKSSRFASSFAIMIANITRLLCNQSFKNLDFSENLVLKSIELMDKVDEKIYHGQMLDLLNELRYSSEEQYLEMIELKTGELFGLATELGALFAGTNDDFRYKFKRLGINLALSFQIKDDLLNICEGKNFGSDIVKGKRTLLYIKCIERSNNDQKKLFTKYYGKDVDDQVKKKLVKIMHELESVRYCNKLCESINNQAKKSLQELKLDTLYSQLFYEYIEFLSMRKF